MQYLCFRLSKMSTIQLIEQLIPFMPVAQRKTAIPHHLQV